MRQHRPSQTPPDRLKVTMLNVGHGDAFLLQWFADSGDPWTVLIDGGPRRTETLQESLAKAGVNKLDRMVLTHVDADHQDGLASLGNLKVTEFWAPCLPAFQRHEWLFPKRVQAALARASGLSC